MGSLTSELSLKYQDLEKQVQSLIKSQEQNQLDTKTYVDNSIAIMEENLNTQIQQNSDKIQHQITALETSSANQLTILTQTPNAVAGNVNLLLSSFNLTGSPTSPSKSTTTPAVLLTEGSGKY